jgi:hypothetical protein
MGEFKLFRLRNFHNNCSCDFISKISVQFGKHGRFEEDLPGGGNIFEGQGWWWWRWWFVCVDIDPIHVMGEFKLFRLRNFHNNCSCDFISKISVQFGKHGRFEEDLPGGGNIFEGQGWWWWRWWFVCVDIDPIHVMGEFKLFRLRNFHNNCSCDFISKISVQFGKHGRFEEDLPGGGNIFEGQGRILPQKWGRPKQNFLCILRAGANLATKTNQGHPWWQFLEIYPIYEFENLKIDQNENSSCNFISKFSVQFGKHG